MGKNLKVCNHGSALRTRVNEIIQRPGVSLHHDGQNDTLAIVIGGDPLNLDIPAPSMQCNACPERMSLLRNRGENQTGRLMFVLSTVKRP